LTVSSLFRLLLPAVDFDWALGKAAEEGRPVMVKALVEQGAHDRMISRVRYVRLPKKEISKSWSIWSAKARAWMVRAEAALRQTSAGVDRHRLLSP